MADFASDIRNLRKELSSGITEKFQKELDESKKKLGSLTKSADDLGKKIGGWVDPAALLDKALGEIGAKQTALQNQAQNYKAVQQRAITDVYAINEQIKERNALDVKARTGATLTSSEQLRYQKLISDNLEAQRLSLGKIAGEAGRNARAASETVSSLSKQKDTLEVISSIYSTIISLGEKYDKLLSDEAKSQGTTKDEIDRQYSVIQKINKEITANLATNQEILKAVSAARKEYVLSDSQLAAVGKQSANISRLSGLTVEESVKFQNSLAEIGGTSQSVQENMAVIAAKAAEASGVPMGLVMKDVANASSVVRTLFKGNTTELIKQAAEARKLGTSLESAAKSADQLLNFETSIGNELKLSALLGKNVNFNESRRLAFAGDIIDAEKALQRELEKIGDLDKLNVFQRKTLVDLTGKDFSELQKIQTQKKNLLEAERMFPEEAAKMRKSQEELNVLQKSGVDVRKKELALILQQKTSEAELAKLTAAKEEALMNLGKILKPVYDGIMFIQIAFFKLITNITSIGDPIGKWATISATALVGLVAAFYTLKFGAKFVLDFIGNLLGKTAQLAGEGIGKGLAGIGYGISAMSKSLNTVSITQIGKMALILGVLTLSVFGLAKAFNMLGGVSSEQIMAFTKSIVILGASLAVLGVIMLIPGLQVGVIAFAAALGVVSLAAIGFAKAIQMVTPALDKIGTIILGLGNIVAGVVKNAFQTMYNVFVKLPAVVSGVAGPLAMLALVSPGLIVAAAGVGALTASLGLLTAALVLFPTSELTRVTTQLSLLAMSATGIRVAASALKELSGIKLDFSIDKSLNEFSQQLNILSNSAEGVRLVVDTLKEIQGLELPKLEVDIKNVDKLKEFNESKQTQNNDLRSGLELVAQKIDNLTNVMINGGIAVNLDGQLVSRTLASTTYKSGGFGQSTTRA